MAGGACMAVQVGFASGKKCYRIADEILPAKFLGAKEASNFLRSSPRAARAGLSLVAFASWQDVLHQAGSRLNHR